MLETAQPELYQRNVLYEGDVQLDVSVVGGVDEEPISATYSALLHSIVESRERDSNVEYYAVVDYDLRLNACLQAVCTCSLRT